MRSPPALMATMPARWIPLLYIAFAHVCLAAACALVAWDARGFAGFFYHPRMVAVVHLVTLGWISGSILGSFYIVGPLALRLTLPAGRADYLAFAGFAGGVAGLFGHLWTASHAGMAWAAALVAASMAVVAGRALRALAASPLPWNARLPVTLAFANLLAAALLGALLGVNKTRPFLPASHLDLVFAHAHLAAVGWAMLMVFGVGYRLLPMVLPAAMPGGPWTYASTVLLQCGLLGIVAAFFREGRGLLPAAALTVAGIAAFFTRVAWMLRHRRPAPRELRRPDWAVAHAMAAFLGLIGASVLGLWLAAVEPSELSMRLVPAYATLGLIGFLSQIVVGMEGRLFPLFAWLWGFADSGHAVLPPSLHQAPPRPLQALGFLLWVAGVPLLAAGLAREADLATAVGAGALCAAAVGNTVVVALVLRRLWRQLPMEEGRSRPN